MKKQILTAALTIVTLFSNAQSTKWVTDASHGKIGFTVIHFGMTELEGRFLKYEGTVLSDKSDFSDAKIDFTADVNSISTDEEQRDKHLKSPDFFDAEKFPQIVFKGKSLKSVGKNKYKLTGDFTMHGITKEVTLDAVHTGTVVDPYKNTKAGFKVTGVINRTLWNLKWNGVLATGEILVSEEVTIDCNFQLLKK